MDDCVFCSIAAGASAAYRVWEDERTLAFLDANPATRGHTLVIPTRHAETLTDVPGGDVAAVFQTVKRVASALESAYEPAGVTVIQSNGRAAGQEVFHAHVHVIPRYEDDSVSLEWAAAETDDSELRDTAAAVGDELADGSG